MLFCEPSIAKKLSCSNQFIRDPKSLSEAKNVVSSANLHTSYNQLGKINHLNKCHLAQYVNVQQ